MPRSDTIFKKGNKFGKGRKPGTTTSAKREIQEHAREFVEGTAYWDNLTRRIFAGTAPHIETLLFHYAYGKPVDRLALTNADGTKDYAAELLEFNLRIARLLGEPDGATAEI